MDTHNLDVFVRTLAYVVGVAILVNLLDDLFIDINYFARGLHRRAKRKLTREDLITKTQQKIAIMVPAWKEAEVIAEMLEHNLATIDYDRSRYVFFCGTYQNDPGTQACVDTVARRSTSVRKVVVPHDGPTSKADCLNWVYQGIILEEERSRERFGIILMHDAEDIIHPLSLRLYNSLIPRCDFVQTPVFSLELRPDQIVAGTYIDEFAEHHLKDMLVREAIGGLVPSAGVGSAFARQAFEDIAGAHDQKPFNVDSLTEDYEIAIKFRLAGKRVHFACRTFERPAELHELAQVHEEYIATREYFPSGFSASVRQRSRWLCGITLQTWRQVGWQGSLPVLYCMWRDRKAVFTNMIVLLAYALVAYLGIAQVIAAVSGSGWSIAKVIPPGSLLSMLVVVNSFALVWRMLLKASFVGRLYGPLQALLSAPRLVAGNLISVLATLRALKQYSTHLWTGEPLRWVKTTHEFPNVKALRARTLRLGEHLLANGLVSEPELKQALDLQTRTSLPLGDVLTTLGLCKRSSVTRALSEQWGIEEAAIDPYKLSRAALCLMSEAEAERLEVLPIAVNGDTVTVAVSQQLSAAELTELEHGVRGRVSLKLVDRQTVHHARTKAYRQLIETELDAGTHRPQRLGERLLAENQLDAEQLQQLLDEQAQTGELLGELLQRKGLVTGQTLRPMYEPWAVAATSNELEVDGSALSRIGFAFCALYSIVPLRQTTRGHIDLAAAFPLPEVVVRRARTELGLPVRIAYAPLFAVVSALASARQQLLAALDAELPPATTSLDACELSAIRHSDAWQGSIQDLWAECFKAARSPIEQLEASGLLDPKQAAELRAQTYRLPAIPAKPYAEAEPASTDDSLLPPSWMRREGVSVLACGRRRVILGTAKPSPALARAAARLLPTWAIEWRVTGALPLTPKNTPNRGTSWTQQSN